MNLQRIWMTLVLVCGVPAVVFGQFRPVGPELQVNTYTIGGQLVNPPKAVASDAAGNFVVVWITFDQDGSGAGLFGQRYSSTGAMLGTEFQVNTYTTGWQGGYGAVVASDAAGNFVVVWDSDGQDGSGAGLFGQRYTAAGAKLGTEFQVNTYTTDNQLFPAVASDAAGNFVVVWESAYNGQDGSSSGVFGQRYSRTGARLGSEFQVNTYTAGDQAGVLAVTSDAAGNFVVVWNSVGQDGSEHGVFGQRYSNTGAKLGSEFQVNTYTASAQGAPSVASDAAGNFMVAWFSYGQDGSSYGVFGQRYASTGEKLGSEFQVNTYTTGHQIFPVVASDAAGNFVVAWGSEGQDGSGFGTFGQRYSNTGAKLGSEFQVNTYTAGSQGYIGVGIASDTAGDFVVAWESDGGQDGDGGGIFAQRFTTSLCDTTPKTTCKKPTQSQTSVLQLKNNTTDSRDSLSWTWPKGEATATADFGDPLQATSYSFCIYDESAGTPSLVLSATAPAAATCPTKPCWKVTGTTGFKYTDARLTNGGLRSLTLKAGAAGAAKITVKGKSVNLGMPALPLAQDTTVIAQLVNSDGACWEATYSAPAIKNQSDQFKDKGD